MFADGYRLLSPHLRGTGWWFPRIARGLAFMLAAIFGVIALTALLGPQFGYNYAVVKSGSMSPAYPPGAVIVIDDVQAESVVAGEVISFKVPTTARDEVITHRVVDVVRDGSSLSFRTKGDANEEPDSSLIESDWVQGRVMFGVPWIGRLAPLAQEKGLFFGIVVVCGVLLIATEMSNILRELRLSKDHKLGSNR